MDLVRDSINTIVNKTSWALGVFLALWLIYLYPSQAYAQPTNYSELRLLGSVDGSPQIISTSLIAGSFNYSAVDPNPDGLGDDGGIVISAADGGFWVRQYSYGVNEPIQLDWFALATNQDISPIIERLLSLTANQLYVLAPLSVSELTASNRTFVDTDAFHFIENTQPLTISLPNPRFFASDQIYDAGNPLELDLPSDENCNTSDWTHESGSQWSIALTDLGFAADETVQSVWSNDPREVGEGKIFHWGGETNDATWTGNELILPVKAAGFMRWYSDATRLYIAASNDCEVIPTEYFENFEVTPDELVQMWHFYNPLDVSIGGPQKNITFKGNFRVDRFSLGGWNGVQTYTFVGGIGNRGPAHDALYGSYALLGFRPERGAAEQDRVSLLANIENCFNFCVNVTGATNETEAGSFGQFTIGGSMLHAGLRFNSGVLNLHADDVTLSNPFIQGFRSGGDAGWSGSTTPSNWDERLYGRAAVSFESTFVVHQTGNVTIEHYGQIAFNTRNGQFSKGDSLSWQAAGGDVFTVVTNEVTELWMDGVQVGQQDGALSNEGDWQWDTGIFSIKASSIDLSKITLVHRRFHARYKDIGWAIDEFGNPEKSDIIHQGFKVDHTGYANPDESFLLYEALPGSYGDFAVRAGSNGGMLKLEASNEGTGAVFNLSEETWTDLGGNLWRSTVPAGLTGSEAVNHLIGNGLSLRPPQSNIANLQAQGQWFQAFSGGGNVDITMYSAGPPTCDPSDIGCAPVYEQLIGGNPYRNEYHNLKIRGFDSEDGVSADVISALLESGATQGTNNGQDYSHNHSFSGVGQMIAMNKGALILHEHSKVSDWIGYDIFMRNAGYSPSTGEPLFWTNIPEIVSDPPPNANNFTRWNRGNELKNILLNGRLIVHGGSRDNSIENIRFNGLPREVITIENFAAEPMTELVINGFDAPHGSWINANVASNVTLTIDGQQVALPYQIGSPTQTAGTAAVAGADSWALFRFNQNTNNDAPGSPLVLTHNHTAYTPVMAPELAGLDHGTEGGGVRAREVSMDTFNDGINVSFWARFDPIQSSFWTDVVTLYGTENNHFQIRLFDSDYSEPWDFKHVHVNAMIEGVGVTASLDNINNNVLDGNYHFFEIAFNPNGDRRIRVALDGVLMEEGQAMPFGVSWINNTDAMAPDIVRNRIGIACSWAHCNNPLQGVIDEVHIRQCAAGDDDCSELVSVTTFADIEDRDGDSMLDNWERANMLDPADAADASLDGDSDGLYNADEFSAQTDPNNPDTDNDGLPDGSDPDPLVAQNSVIVPLPTFSYVVFVIMLVLMGARATNFRGQSPKKAT